jgi:hypothetical protein
VRNLSGGTDQTGGGMIPADAGTMRDYVDTSP